MITNLNISVTFQDENKILQIETCNFQLMKINEESITLLDKKIYFEQISEISIKDVTYPSCLVRTKTFWKKKNKTFKPTLSFYRNMHKAINSLAF